MKIALVDNGSLEPAAHAGLRAAAVEIGKLARAPVEAVSWRHSDRIRPQALDGRPAATLKPWIRAQTDAGEREFLFVPFFVSPQGAIGSALRRDLETLREETGGFGFSFADGLSSADALAAIVEDRVRRALPGLRSPAVIVVDHGGPSAASAAVRDRVAAAARERLGASVRSLTAASMESPDGPGFGFNRPLLSEALGAAGPGDALIAPLFLLPGRHAGPGGDLERISRAAEARVPGLRCHFTRLVGSHPLAVEALASALSRALGAAIPS